MGNWFKMKSGPMKVDNILNQNVLSPDELDDEGHYNIYVQELEKRKLLAGNLTKEDVLYYIKCYKATYHEFEIEEV